MPPVRRSSARTRTARYPDRTPDQFAGVIDVWLSVLSRLGLNARQIGIYGSLEVWQRRQVCGVTLRFRHADVTFGDVNLLWNAEDPDRMAVDLGSGLERLAWLRSRSAWREVAYGRFAAAASSQTLDAIRTATLLLGCGIRPGPRGAGGTTRRMITEISSESALLGVDAMVRFAHRFWSAIHPLQVDWPVIASGIETERDRLRPWNGS
jgi:hypothetical protein